MKGFWNALDEVFPGTRHQRCWVHKTVYVARISLDENDVRDITEFRPLPGMPAEVYIETAERTFMHYLMQPILDSMARAFRED